PLVLCYLEGQTQEQVARQLGWPLGTVRSRLARARERLRKRLASRGLTLAAGPFAVVLAANASAAPPPARLAPTTPGVAGRAAGGQAVASTVWAHVVTLLDAAGKSLSAMKLKTAVAVLAGLCVLGAGAGTVTQRASTSKDPEARRSEEPKAVAATHEQAQEGQA